MYAVFILYYRVNVVNIDEAPNPVLYDLHLTEKTGPVMINLTTIDSNDPLDNYTRSVSLQ